MAHFPAQERRRHAHESLCLLYVAITRARHKLVVVGSPAFFTRVPRTETGLLAHQCFTAYYQMCQAQRALFKQSAM